MKVRINRLDHTDDLVFNEILSMLRNDYKDEVSKFFIYHDENYPAYLRKISLDHQNFWLYSCVDTDTDDFIGFAMLRVNLDNLFLNQIMIKPAYQFMGLGAYLLYSVLAQIKNDVEAERFNYLELDAFVNNIHARRVYHHLGMQSSPGLNWYAVKTAFITKYAVLNTTETKQIAYRIAADHNNFSQLFTNQLPIGTIVNRTCAKINGKSTTNLASLIKYLAENTTVDNICITSSESIDIPLMDHALLYRIKFSEALNWTQK